MHFWDILHVFILNCAQFPNINILRIIHLLWNLRFSHMLIRFTPKWPHFAELIRSKSYLFVISSLIFSQATYIHLAVSVIVGYRYSKNHSFFYRFSDVCHVLKALTPKGSHLLNKFLVKTICLWSHLQCCHKLNTFTSQWAHLLNVVLVRSIHLWWNIRCCQVSKVFTLKTNQLMKKLFLTKIHLLCNLQYCYVLKTFTIKWN